MNNLWPILQSAAERLAEARHRFAEAGTQPLRNYARDRLLEETAYGVQNCLRALSMAQLAQGIEAASAAETVKHGSVHESPVAESDAPKPNRGDQ